MGSIITEIIQNKKLQKKAQDKLLNDLQNLFGDWLDSIRLMSSITVVKSSMYYNFVKTYIAENINFGARNEKELNDAIISCWNIWKPYARRIWIKNERLGRIIRRGKTQLYDLP